MTVWDVHSNFGYATVTAAPSPGTSGTTLVLGTTNFADFLDPGTVGYNVVVWPAGTIPLSTNAEIIRVVTKGTNGTINVTRQQESTSARTITVGDQCGVAITKKVITDIEGTVPTEATGAEVNTGTATTKYSSPKAITDSYIYNVYNSMARQAIINGNFDVWQRRTSVAMTAANAYTADRWYCETATAGTDKTVSRQDGTGVNGSYYSARVAMVQDQDELLTFSQALESQDSIKFRGKKLTLSFYAKGGAEFVADNSTLVSKIVTGKGTDQKVLAFTTSADAISQNNVLTTSWVKFTCTTTNVIAADITQVGVSFSFTHAGSGVTTNYFEVTQVQLCAGDVALPFQPKSYDDELKACMRYYEKVGAEVSGTYPRFCSGHCETTGQIETIYYFKVPKRNNAYTLETDGTAADYIIYSGAVVFTCSVVPSIKSAAEQTRITACVNGVTAGTMTVGRGANLLGNNNANAYLAFANEL